MRNTDSWKQLALAALETLDLDMAIASYRWGHPVCACVGLGGELRGNKVAWFSQNKAGMLLRRVFSSNSALWGLDIAIASYRWVYALCARVW